MRSFLAALVLAATALAAVAQQPPVFEVGLDLVYVTATVRDDEGRVVRSLRAEDFVLWEDDRVQRVQLFATAAGPEQREELELNLGMLFDTSESMARQPAPQPRLGGPLSRFHPAGAGPHPDLLRPRHPHLALQLGEPAGDLRARSWRPRARGSPLFTTR